MRVTGELGWWGFCWPRQVKWRGAGRAIGDRVVISTSLRQRSQIVRRAAKIAQVRQAMDQESSGERKLPVRCGCVFAVMIVSANGGLVASAAWQCNAKREEDSFHVHMCINPLLLPEFRLYGSLNLKARCLWRVWSSIFFIRGSVLLPKSEDDRTSLTRTGLFSKLRRTDYLVPFNRSCCQNLAKSNLYNLYQLCLLEWCVRHRSHCLYTADVQCLTSEGEFQVATFRNGWWHLGSVGK